MRKCKAIDSLFEANMSNTHFPTLQYLVAEFLVGLGPHMLHFAFTFKDPEPFV